MAADLTLASKLALNRIRRRGSPRRNVKRRRYLSSGSPRKRIAHKRAPSPDRVLLAFAGEQFDLICFDRIILSLPGSEHCEAAVDALRTMSAMRMKDRHVANARAASCVRDQVGKTVRRDPRNDLRFGHPCERIHHFELAPNQSRH